jgi:lipoprotein-anchoring transpeptidase ErfK/SrfK
VSWFDPPAGDGPSTPRVLAVGGAVAITAMALAGSLGFGPGAQSPSPTHSASAPSTAAADFRAADNDSSSTSGSGSWLTVEGGPSDTGTSSSSDPGGTPDQSEGTAPPSNGSGPANGSGSSSDSGSLAQNVPLPANSGTGRRVVYDISAQRVWLVDGTDSVERTYPVSGARNESLLPPNTYQVTSRDRDAVSFNNKETMHYMVRFASGRHSAIGFHDIPARPDGSLVQTRADLGTPLSAGCIRQWEPDAKAMWRFASIDTPVIVVA